jgi:hypothetical protein
VRTWSPACVFVCVGLLVIACKKEDEEPTNNGVNDVRKACEIRAAWINPSAEKCGLCLAAAPRPACGCESFVGFDGACEKQGELRKNEPSCTEAVDRCAIDCKTDCPCVEACYANAAECKRRSAMRDGCVAEVCSKYCN